MHVLVQYDGTVLPGLMPSACVLLQNLMRSHTIRDRLLCCVYWTSQLGAVCSAMPHGRLGCNVPVPCAGTELELAWGKSLTAALAHKLLADSKVGTVLATRQCHVQRCWPHVYVAFAFVCRIPTVS